MPGERTGHSNMVQEAVIKTISKKKKCKKAKWLSEDVLQIPEKREVKGKGEKERYTHLNSEFQRTARRDKKAFLSDQRKEVEERNRIEKTGKAKRKGKLYPFECRVPKNSKKR